MSEAVRKGVLLAETLEKVKPAPDPTGWWISEKLDGVRAYWDGKHFYSRNNLMFDAPDWFKEGLPKDSHLDGELWCGREQFERCVGIIKYHKGSTAAEWKHLCFLIFDAPVVKGDTTLPYEKRNEFCEQVAKQAPYAAAVGIRKCEGQPHLESLLQAVCAHGGEGLMLRQPGSLYARARSKTLLKVKTFMDAEAKVVGYAEGKNRLQGMMGALQLQMPMSGFTFEVGTGFKDSERNLIGAKKRWPVGTVINYKYQNLTAKGVPRFPVFLRVRSDKAWADVEADAQADLLGKSGGPPSAKRQPSLMAEAISPPSSDAVAATLAVSSNEATEETALPRPERTASGSLLFTDDAQVGRAEAIAEAIAAREAKQTEAPPSKRAKTAAATRLAAVESVGPGARAVWSWRSGGGWVAYSDAENDALEEAHGAVSGNALANGTAGTTRPVVLPSGYVVDLGRMAQWTPSAPSKKRGVRREVKDVVTRKVTRQLSQGVV